jgi:hypothetical protein
MKRSMLPLLLFLVACLASGPVLAAPKLLKPFGKVTASEGLLHDSFAFDETGSNLATIQFTAKGTVELVVGPPGGKPRVSDISSFTSTPEKLLGLSGYWFVVSNEGRRRAAISPSTTARFHSRPRHSSPIQQRMNLTETSASPSRLTSPMAERSCKRMSSSKATAPSSGAAG